MGNGASVKKVKVDSEVNQVDDASYLNRSNSVGQLETPRFHAQKLRSENEELQVIVEKLQQQVGWLETTKLDLEDRIESLSSQCEDLKRKNTEFVSENIRVKSEMRKIQSDLSIKTEALDVVQRELDQMKQQAKSRTKHMQRKMAEFKQNLSLELFELRQENEELKSSLYKGPTEHQRSMSSFSASQAGSDSSAFSTDPSCLEENGMGDNTNGAISNSSLVVKLSSKIEEQQLEIAKLKEKVKSSAVLNGESEH